MSAKTPDAPDDGYRLSSPERVDPDALRGLYDSVGWAVYPRDIDQLVAAIEGSSFVVVAEVGEELIGLARVVSDDVSVAYIQDILVHPDHHRRGVGRALVEAALERYRHVRLKALLTDDRPEQLRFYASLGFSNTRELQETPLNAFVIIEGAKLT